MFYNIQSSFSAADYFNKISEIIRKKNIEDEDFQKNENEFLPVCQNKKVKNHWPWYQFIPQETKQILGINNQRRSKLK